MNPHRPKHLLSYDRECHQCVTQFILQSEGLDSAFGICSQEFNFKSQEFSRWWSLRDRRLPAWPGAWAAALGSLVVFKRAACSAEAAVTGSLVVVQRSRGAVVTAIGCL